MAENNEKVFLTEQGVEDFTKALGTKFVWLSRLFDSNNKILPTLLPDFILGQVMFGGTIDANGIITPSNAYRNRYAGEFANGEVTLDVDSLAASTHEGVYFIASAKGESGVVEPTKLGVEIGDWVISNGQIWTKIDNTDAVKSVANLTGAISAEALRNATLADTANTMWYASAKGVLSSFATTQYGRNLLSAEAMTKVVGLFAEKAEKDSQGNVITSTYMPFTGGTFTGDVTHSANLILANSKVIAGKDTSGSNVSLLSLNSSNQVVIGYGAHNKYDTLIYGNKITAYGDICGQKGVSAKGIADFGVSGGGGGGTAYTLNIVPSDSKVSIQLKGADGSSDTKEINIFSTSQAGVVPKTNSTSSLLFGSGWRALQASDIPSLDWSKITSGKPTTLGGYGITDAYTKSQIENGIFPNMRVGLADDLGDIEEPLDVEYTYQPTANPNEIRDGYAQIESLKGNSVVWNQLVNNPNFVNNSLDGWNISSGVSCSIENRIIKITQLSGTIFFNTFVRTIANHKYYISLRAGYYGTSNEVTTMFYLGSKRAIEVIPTNSLNIHKVIHTCRQSNLSSGTTGFSTYPNTGIESLQIDADYGIIIHDLTQMFGEGNEPTTVEEFERRCPKGMSMDYNEGEVIHFNGDIKSVGFNQWDGNIKRQGFINNDATISNSVNYCISEKIKVIPNTSYYILGATGSNPSIVFYDKNGNYISGVKYIDVKLTNEFTTPSNADYLLASIPNETKDTFCINISDEDKNGTYEPYTEFRRDLPTDLFDGGMKGRGTAYDEVYWDEAKRTNVKVQRFGKVDLGTLNWSNRASNSKEGVFSTSIANRKVSPSFNALCALYNNKGTAPSVQNMQYAVDKSLYGYYQEGQNGTAIYIYNSAYTDAESFKAAMSGVMLYYELAEPIIEEIDIPYMDYEVSNDGTEQVISDTPTTPIKARVVYNFDAIGTIRQNRFDVSTLKGYIPNGIANQAHKLATPRTIWGQSFDGTGNVSGAMSGVTNINNTLYLNSSGNVTIGASDLAGTSEKLYVDGRVYSSRGFLIKEDYGIWQGRQYTGSLIETDIVYNATKHYFTGGNVGIGTNTPQYKLDVNGDIKATNIYASGETIEATGTRALTINRNNGNNSLIFFKSVVNGSSNDLGYLGFNGINSPIFYSVEGNTNALLHAGNTSLSVDDTKDGFTLNVNGNQVGMSAMTKARIEEIVNAAIQD